MADLTIRNVENETVEALKRRAETKILSAALDRFRSRVESV